MLDVLSLIACLFSTIDRHLRNLPGLLEVTGDVMFSTLLKSNFLLSWRINDGCENMGDAPLSSLSSSILKTTLLLRRLFITRGLGAGASLLLFSFWTFVCEGKPGWYKNSDLMNNSDLEAHLFKVFSYLVNFHRLIGRLRPAQDLHSRQIRRYWYPSQRLALRYWLHFLFFR